MTGFNHNVDDFNFEVINNPFPQSNINSMLGNSHLTRYRLCNNIKDFLFRAKVSYSKLVKPGYMQNFWSKYLKIFCLTYKIDLKMLWEKIMIYYFRYDWMQPLCFLLYE